jgi:hypothetical protein
MEKGAGRSLASAAARAAAGIRSTLPFHAVVLVYTALVILVSADYGQTWTFTQEQYLQRLGIVYFCALPLFAAVTVSATCASNHRTGRSAILDALSPPDAGHFVSGLLMLFSFVVMMGSFTTFKNLMPQIMGDFLYDRLQADIDQFLHFGHDPGPAMVSLPVGRFVQTIIGWNYSILWSILSFIPPFFIATGNLGRAIRLRYFLSAFAVWVIVGNVLACLFLSGGPAFYGEITGDAGRFADVLHVVKQGGSGFGSPAAFQAYLWHNYHSGQMALGSGISAFPSVHVAVAMMNALFLHEFSRRAGLFGFAYVGITLVSSVWLGWHYAIDGYASILVVLALHAGIKYAFAKFSR